MVTTTIVMIIYLKRKRWFEGHRSGKGRWMAN
jgi:hypothetical protein